VVTKIAACRGNRCEKQFDREGEATGAIAFEPPALPQASRADDGNAGKQLFDQRIVGQQQSDQSSAGIQDWVSQTFGFPPGCVIDHADVSQDAK